MPDALVFILGFAVTLVTFAAVGAIWWAALRDPHEDGTYAEDWRERDEAERRRLRRAA